MTGFSQDQTKQLGAPLERKKIKTRKGAGDRVIPYVEAWRTIDEANRIFGFDGWSRETVAERCVFAGDKQTRQGPKPYVCYTAKVRVTVYAGDRVIVREGSGDGSGFGADLGEAHASALKEAESDATKRALVTFGNAFGLALYDKDYANVERRDAGEAEAAVNRPSRHEEAQREAAVIYGDDRPLESTPLPSSPIEARAFMDRFTRERANTFPGDFDAFDARARDHLQRAQQFLQNGRGVA